MILAILAGAAALGVLPDPDLTPGAVLTTSAQVVCSPAVLPNGKRVGYAKSVRDVPQSEKRAVLATYRRVHPDWPPCPPLACEVDHLISLELGGSNDASNLWPEPYEVPGAPGYGARDKDKVENELHRRVCSGALDIREAQRRIRSDWRFALTDGRYQYEVNGRVQGYIKPDGTCWVVDVHGEATRLNYSPDQCVNYLGTLKP